MYSKESIAELDEEIRLLEYRLSTLKYARKERMAKYYWFKKAIEKNRARKYGVKQVKRYPLP